MTARSPLRDLYLAVRRAKRQAPDRLLLPAPRRERLPPLRNRPAVAWAKGLIAMEPGTLKCPLINLTVSGQQNRPWHFCHRSGISGSYAETD